MITYKLPLEVFKSLQSEIDVIGGEYFIKKRNYQFVTVTGKENNERLRKSALTVDIDITKYDVSNQIAEL